MQKKQATGLDTRMMMPVYAGIFCILCQYLLPWISIPVLRYSKLPTAYRLSQMGQCVENIQTCVQTGGKLQMPPLTAAELDMLRSVLTAFRWVSVAVTVLLAVCCIVVLIKKTKSKKMVYTAFSLHLLLAVSQTVLLMMGNVWLNDRMGRPNSFINLSLHSYMQLTSWVYAQILVCVGILALTGRFLSIREEAPPLYVERTSREDRRVGRRTWTAIVLILVAIPLVILFGIYFLNDRSSVFIGLCIICLAMLPFAMVFEDRKPQARELLLIAVMSGIAVAGRMAFFMVPQFKPVTAVVIIAGIGLGAEAGFLTGAISGFVSNFFFGQGPWTPWQMFAYGIIGFLAGLLFHRSRRLAKAPDWAWVLIECVYGGLATLVIYGLIMDASGVLNFSSGFTWEMLLAKIISGLPFNFIHAVSTVVFLWLLARPMEKKLDRIKKKYGILEV